VEGTQMTAGAEIPMYRRPYQIACTIFDGSDKTALFLEDTLFWRTKKMGFQTTTSYKVHTRMASTEIERLNCNMMIKWTNHIREKFNNASLKLNNHREMPG
jgi:hypothetical protein